jgi:hypothetical protein
MKKIILILILITSSVCFSQSNTDREISLNGVVISDVSKKPFDYGVYVIVKNQTKGTISEENGEFNLQSNFSIKDSIIGLTFSAVGYKTYDTIINITQSRIEDLVIYLKSESDINKNKALNDIENGDVKILLSSGIAPITYNSDKKFTKKYKVYFYDYGCEAIAYESLFEYNKTVFEFLDNEYGDKWRNSIRKDVIGLISD